MKSAKKTLLLAIASLVASPQCAFSNYAFTQPQSIPTLDEWGMVGLILVVGVAGGLVMRWNAKKR